MTALLVANDGGHLMQLVTLAPRLGLTGEPVWLTVETPQTRSMLAGRRVVWMDPAPTRDWRAVVRNAVRARAVIRRVRPSVVVSTGASLALSVLPVARAARIRAYYVESATRVDGPSVSGKILRRVPGVSMFTQHAGWADRTWQYRGNVFDGMEVVERTAVAQPASASPELRKIVVTLGTSETFGFRRMLDQLVPLIPGGAEVLWQTGSTDTSGLDILARPTIPSAELLAAMRDADVVVAHAGTGSALGALAQGKVPVLVPRRREHGEHVDDHQLQIAGMLGERGLAIVAEADDLDLGILCRAASLKARLRSEAPAIDLGL